MGRLVKKALAVVTVFVSVWAGGLVWMDHLLPDTFTVIRGQTLKLAQMPWLTPAMEQDVAAQAVHAGESYNVTLTMFGKIPVKTVRAVAADRKNVTVCGTPFGVKMFSQGAMVVGFSDVSVPAGYANPAKAAGLKLGDRILKIDGRKTGGNEDVARAIQQSEGRSVQIVYQRDQQKPETTELYPLQDREGKWQAGMWVRDSSAGIGTLTFVDNTSGIYGGMGHPINDNDTGKRITLRSGEIAPVKIIGIRKGEAGLPGELKGCFTGISTMGDISVNGATGVYGHINKVMKGPELPTAQVQEVRQGPAQIRTTVDAEGPRNYQVEIERVSLTEKDPNRNMVIHITDPALLDAAGGIVQGMSGSPIIQDGRLVGAVTHVLVNDPTRGYGIFIENMLKAADSAA